MGTGNPFFTLILLSLLLFISQDEATLSKSDSNRKKTQTQPILKKAKDSEESSTPLDFQFRSSDILKNYQHVDFKEDRKFSNPVLGYVTPWNNHGYDMAKHMAQKFTHISPVWFQVKPNGANADLENCKITGTQDLDQGWISDVRQNNSGIKIVPRFLLEQWTPEQLRHLFAYNDVQEKCIKDIVQFCLRNKFDGVVFELWTSIMSYTQGHSVQELVDMLVIFGETLSKHSLELILPVPPPLNENNQLTGMFTQQYLRALAPYVDYFNVMLYDFTKESRPGPIAPIDWVRKCLVELTANEPLLSSKIMAGINFYGYGYNTKSGHVDAILGSRFIDVLKVNKPEIQWNRATAEHYVQTKDLVIFYPTLVSIETRLKLAEEVGAGIGVWELGQGLDYFFNLL